MLIGLIGRPGAGQDAAAEYLAKAHGFVVIRFGSWPRSDRLPSPCPKEAIEETGPYPTLVPDIVYPLEARVIHDLGGLLVRLVNHHAPHRGDEPAIPADLITRSIDVPVDLFPFYDCLDQLVDEEAWAEASPA